MCIIPRGSTARMLVPSAMYIVLSAAIAMPVNHNGNTFFNLFCKQFINPINFSTHIFAILKRYRITANCLNSVNAFQKIDRYFNSFLTFRMSQFRMNCRTFVAAMSFVAWDTSLATTDDGLDIDAGILDLFQREGLQYLMLLRIADV